MRTKANPSFLSHRAVISLEQILNFAGSNGPVMHLCPVRAGKQHDVDDEFSLHTAHTRQYRPLGFSNRGLCENYWQLLQKLWATPVWSASHSLSGCSGLLSL